MTIVSKIIYCMRISPKYDIRDAIHRGDVPRVIDCITHYSHWKGMRVSHGTLGEISPLRFAIIEGQSAIAHLLIKEDPSILQENGCDLHHDDSLRELAEKNNMPDIVNAILGINR